MCSFSVSAQYWRALMLPQGTKILLLKQETRFMFRNLFKSSEKSSDNLSLNSPTLKTFSEKLSSFV